MGKTKYGTRCPEELRASGADAFGSRARICEQIVPLLGRALRSNVPRDWVKPHETDASKRDGMTTAERDHIKVLEPANRQLREAKVILKKGEAIFRHRLSDRWRFSAAFGDHYDSALAETIIGLFKAGVNNRLGPSKPKDQVELETLQWVDWCNKERLLEPPGYITPIEAEERHERALKSDKIAA